MDYMQLAGTTLGRYELHEFIGDEAHVVATYRGYQPALKRHVAVQVLNPAQEGWRQGFVRAAEIMADLEHSNIVPVHDFDIHDIHTFIVTRLMTGGFTAEAVRSRHYAFAGSRRSGETDQ